MLIGHEADVCIIGSGVAGALIAHECATRGMSVLVLEAGPRLDRARRPEQEQRYLATGLKAWPSDPDRDAYVNSSAFPYSLNATRVRAVGGSTLHWTAVALRMRESDFETKTRFGLGIDWPLRYRDLEPYYGRAEHELGVSGDANGSGPWRSAPFPMEGFPDAYSDRLWRQAAEAVGVTLERTPYARNNLRGYDGRPPCATYATCHICPIGAQYSADWHVLKAESTGRCTVLADTPARRIALDSGGQVQRVHATGWDGSAHEVTARAVVVAAHAVETARLLLLSKIGNDAHVGRYLMEHWEIAGGGTSDEPSWPQRVGFPVLTSFAHYEGSDRGRRGAIKIDFRSAEDPLLAFGSQPGLWGRAMAQHDCRHFGRLRTIEVSTEHQPNPESRVTLDADARDPHGDPAPNVRFVLGDIDRETQAAARGAMRTLLEGAKLSDIRIPDRFTGAAHHIGTCRMSERPEDGVVDADGRVHGTQNLFVAGSSVFPTGSGVNPTLTIAALSLRLADHIRASLSAPR
jgi:glucose dehydrogenase